MARIRITKEFKFEMAHALLDYNGPCKNIHGHSYYLYVTLIGEVAEKPGASENGMVMDFGILKEIVKTSIVDQLDHALVLNSATPKEVRERLKGFDNVVLLPYQPTCENLLLDFSKRIKAKLPLNIKLHSLRLNETVTSYAEWFADDND
jgi:6-pyruvoyltetrahydropterin/6-carboxytetrahydropterin synthase